MINTIVRFGSEIASKAGCDASIIPTRLARLAAAPALGLLLWIAATGCNTAPPPSIPMASASANSLLLHEGDVLQVRFPAAPDMDALVAIRSDGKITIPSAGDVKVAGLTPDAARQAVLAVAAPMLKVQDVTVTVQSSAFIIYVSGAVLRPGEIVSDRPLTPFEAVIKAGIDNSRSNLSKVKVIRTDANGHTGIKILNLQKIITDGQTEPFALQPYDVLYVPEKFSMF